MGRKIDLTGKVFRKLTVVKEHPERTPQGSVQWVCQCECGNSTIVSGDNLRRNHTLSCGCLQKESAQARVINLVGQRFGKLTVIDLFIEFKKSLVELIESLDKKADEFKDIIKMYKYTKNYRRRFFMARIGYFNGVIGNFDEMTVPFSDRGCPTIFSKSEFELCACKSGIFTVVLEYVELPCVSCCLVFICFPCAVFTV